MPSSKTPTDDIELSPGAANEKDERFICGELKNKKGFSSAKETVTKFYKSPLNSSDKSII